MADLFASTEPLASPACIDCCDTTPRPRRERCEKCYRRHIAALKAAGAFTPQNAARTALSRLLEKTTPGYGGCVIWTGGTNWAGYGDFKDGARSGSAHRAAYELLGGPIAEGLQLDHVCHTRDASCAGGSDCLHRRCINPHHLEPVTPSENTRRSRPANKAYCINGHLLDDENTYHRPQGGRGCRTCRNNASRKYREARSSTLSQPDEVQRPSRRLVAAGFTRRLPDRTLTVRVTEAGVTGRLSKNERVAELHRLARADWEQAATSRATWAAQDHSDLFGAVTGR